MRENPTNALAISFAIAGAFHGVEDVNATRRVLQHFLDALVKTNIDYLRTHPETPRLYESGVVYKREPRIVDPYTGLERTRELWQDLPFTLATGQGDCEDLGCWLAAERTVFDRTPSRAFAKPRVMVDPNTGERFLLWHIRTLVGGRKVEDPSARLGMRDSDWVARYEEQVVGRLNRRLELQP
jgi:hypothetical protein